MYKYVSLLFVIYLQTSCSSEGGSIQEVTNNDQSGNRRLVSVETSFDSGRLDIISYRYDALGFPLSYQLVSDGVIIETAVYFVEPNGLIQRMDKDSGGDGSIDTTIYFQYENGQLISRQYDTEFDESPELLRTSNFDNFGRYSGYIEYALSVAGEEQGITAEVLVSYPSDSLVVSERDFMPLGSPDVRIEYMTQETGEITTSIETYFTYEESSSVTTWTYENEVCDMRWQGSVYTEHCLELGE